MRTQRLRAQKPTQAAVIPPRREHRCSLPASSSPKGQKHKLLSASSCWCLCYNAGLKLHSSLLPCALISIKGLCRARGFSAGDREEGGARSFGIWTPGLFLILSVAQAKHESNKKGRELGREPHPGELRTHHPMRHQAPSLRVLAQGQHTPARARASQTRLILVGRGADQERL